MQGLFDLIIGSDVLYERDDHGHLAGFILRHAAPAAEVLIVDPNRSNRPAFSRRLAAQGFVLCDTPLGATGDDAAPLSGPAAALHAHACALNAAYGTSTSTVRSMITTNLPSRCITRPSSDPTSCSGAPGRAR